MKLGPKTPWLAMPDSSNSNGFISRRHCEEPRRGDAAIPFQKNKIASPHLFHSKESAGARNDRKTALISEIFSSLQGEGPYMGERHLFLRFSGCDLDCVYCDEDLKLGRKMSLAEVLKKIDKLEKSDGPHSFVSLTGGEPLLQLEFLTPLLPELRSRHLKILLETNGIRWGALEKVSGLCDVIAMDLKLGSVGHHQDYLEEHRKFLRIACSKKLCIKMIVSHEFDRDEFDRHIQMVVETAPSVPVFIQPVWNEHAKLTDLLKALIEKARTQLPDVRLGFQLHKMLHIR